MNKNNFSYICLLTPAVIGCQPGDTKHDISKLKPNVILFLIDDFGYGDISFEGNSQIQTPNIDRIARGGASFKRFYQSAGASAPPFRYDFRCTPGKKFTLNVEFKSKTGVKNSVRAYLTGD